MLEMCSHDHYTLEKHIWPFFEYPNIFCFGQFKLTNISNLVLNRDMKIIEMIRISSVVNLPILYNIKN